MADTYTILKGEFEPLEILDYAVTENTDYYSETDDPQYVMYAAMRKHGESDIWALIVLVNLRGSIISYKEMGEDIEPYYYDCLRKILDW